MQVFLLTLINYYSIVFGVDPHLVESIVHVESSFNPRAVGSIGERGLLQIRPEYVRVRPLTLFDPELNIFYGVRKLSERKERIKHKHWYLSWNTGVVGFHRVKDPSKHPYVKKIKSVYKNNVKLGMVTR